MAVHILHGESHAAGGTDLFADVDALTSGESTMPRGQVSSSGVQVGSSQSLRLSYFMAKKTEVVTQIRLITGGTAAAATPTLCRAGIYSEAANGDLTLVGSFANDTALFAGASTVYTKTLTASFTKTAGVRYAVGILVVTATTLPQFTGQTALNTTEATSAPRLTAAVSGQSDLPSSVANASLAGSGSRIYAAMIP